METCYPSALRIFYILYFDIEQSGAPEPLQLGPTGPHWASLGPHWGRPMT